jgi:hypothetical protein
VSIAQHTKVKRGRVQRAWTILDKDDGTTLPVALVRNPDWFLWRMRNRKFYGQVGIEAEELYEKARRIKIRRRHPENWEVQYGFDDTGQFQEFSIVRVGSYMHSSINYRRHRLPYLDLLCFEKPYDKKGGSRMIRCFREEYFDGKNLTRDRVEAFFNDDKNFDFDD